MSKHLFFCSFKLNIFANQIILIDMVKYVQLIGSQELKQWSLIPKNRRITLEKLIKRMKSEKQQQQTTINLTKPSEVLE